MTINAEFPRGSEWRKWDLHIHTPYTKCGNRYKTTDQEVWDKFCDFIESSDVDVFGITDYFSCDNYFTFIKTFNLRYPKSKKQFFLNIELRLNESVNPLQEEVNTHLIFNPQSLTSVNKFLEKLKIVQTAKDETPLYCSDLEKTNGFNSATVTREFIDYAFKEVFGKKADRKNHFLIITAANNDGIRPRRGIKRKEIITDEIDKFSDAFFGGSQNIAHFLNIDRLEDPQIKIRKKPTITGSDAHSLEEFEKYVGKHVNEVIDGKEITVNEITWIKADPTYEGLLQIIYDPIPGDRIKIGQMKPDRKDNYKIISKICFDNTCDFPQEINFNQNLSTIIGSRSSGKSALLSYIAHGVDSDLAKRLTLGPGEGENYHWDKIDITHTVYWGNHKTNEESVGKVIYIPQNHLFDKSKDSNEIKKRIEPVLFKKYPKFEAYYLTSNSEILSINKSIDDRINEWFDCENNKLKFNTDLIDIGDRNSIDSTIADTKEQIQQLNNEAALDERELREYQRINALRIKLKELHVKFTSELEILDEFTVSVNYFKDAKIDLYPSLDKLPQNLNRKIIQDIDTKRNAIIGDANKILNHYKDILRKSTKNILEYFDKLNKENEKLIEKYKKFEEIEILIKKLTADESKLKKINDLNAKITNEIGKQTSIIYSITQNISKRKIIIESIIEKLIEEKQDDQSDIKYNIEISLKKLLETVENKINTKENTPFVKRGSFDIDKAKGDPKLFLEYIFYNKQKVLTGYDKTSVAIEVLTLTDELLFVAEMEGDKIGGFSESTMTPGKRALFLLRLILDESNDSWPLLIDQPEDDLDSRSIYNEIVPFIKKKKKERQIIMVTHNANMAIGADSEQIIVANRNGIDRINKDGKQFNYLTGSLEFTKKEDTECADTLLAKGICEHACEILDGGKTAFEQRKNKYNI